MAKPEAGVIRPAMMTTPAARVTVETLQGAACWELQCYHWHLNLQVRVMADAAIVQLSANQHEC